MRTALRFLRRGKVVELTDVDPNETLLDYLRLREASRGTKEGCAEGDCGACSVALGTLRDGALVYEPVNSCIQLLGMIDGKELVAVDDLASPEGTLHPVQQAMVDCHATQCGFCTPGFIMALFTLYQADCRPDRTAVTDWLAGNLCRCTGYRPIVDAALTSCAQAPDDRYAAARQETVAQLAELADGQDLFVGSEDRFFAAPASEAALAALYGRHSDAVLVAGATDVGLWINKQLRDLPKIIHLGRIAGFNAIEEGADEIIIGAGATYAEAEATLQAIDPDIGEVLRRLGSKQVRASGTIGGNIANGSPIGDSPPLLIALGATLVLRSSEGSRELPLEDFFLDYGKQDRRPGEFVSRIHLPKLNSDQVFRSYKISKRFDQDISAILAAFNLTLEGPVIIAARLAFGGMAATPKRAQKTEQVLLGARLDDPATWQAALDSLEQDFQPIDDMRASAWYRMASAQGLLQKALDEIAGATSTKTRVMGTREADLEHVA